MRRSKQAQLNFKVQYLKVNMSSNRDGRNTPEYSILPMLAFPRDVFIQVNSSSETINPNSAVLT